MKVCVGGRGGLRKWGMMIGRDKGDKWTISHHHLNHQCLPMTPEHRGERGMPYSHVTLSHIFVLLFVAFYSKKSATKWAK